MWKRCSCLSRLRSLKQWRLLLCSWYHWKALWRVGVHQARFIMFRPIVEKLLNIEQFLQWEFLKIRIKNYRRIWAHSSMVQPCKTCKTFFFQICSWLTETTLKWYSNSIWKRCSLFLMFEISQTMAPLVVLCSWYHWKALWRVGVHQARFIMFWPIVEKLLNIEQFLQWKFF
jgi:hypothetical protein